jgi:hypothetical protein
MPADARERDGHPVASKNSSRAAEPQVTKRRVTLTNWLVTGVDEHGNPVVMKNEQVDYVPDDVRDGVNVLEAYLAAVHPNWQSVVVSDEPDAGPGGYHGQTHIPENLDHPLAGHTFAATDPKGA